MFVLTEMSDLIRTPPYKFKYILKNAIEEDLNKKLANKVNKELFKITSTVMCAGFTVLN